jgi:hypothetical protein
VEPCGRWGLGPALDGWLGCVSGARLGSYCRSGSGGVDVAGMGFDGACLHRRGGDAVLSTRHELGLVDVVSLRQTPRTSS